MKGNEESDLENGYNLFLDPKTMCQTTVTSLYLGHEEGDRH